MSIGQVVSSSPVRVMYGTFIPMKVSKTPTLLSTCNFTHGQFILVMLLLIKDLLIQIKKRITLDQKILVVKLSIWDPERTVT